MPHHKRTRSPHPKKSKRHRERSRENPSHTRSHSSISERPHADPNLSRRSPLRSSREPSRLRASSRERLLRTMHDFFNYMRRQESPASSEVSEEHTGPASPLLPEGLTTSMDEPGEASFSATFPTAERTVDNSRGSDPSTPAPTHSTVTFTTPVVTAQFEDGGPAEAPPVSTFALELFGQAVQPPAVSSWLPIILETTQSEVRSGLKEDLRNHLLTQYEPKDHLAFLAPPRVNREIIPNLSATVVARDRHQLTSQAQVGASLNALGSGISELSQLDWIQSSTEGKAAVTKIADGIRLLADHHFRLSQTRRAFIVPSLNFLGKSASDSAPIDDCLFGSNFAEEINAAQSIERVARKMARKPPPPSASQARPPAPHSRQQANQQRERIPQKQGNSRTPLPRNSSVHPSKRGAYSQSRTRRSTSRSRVGPRR